MVKYVTNLLKNLSTRKTMKVLRNHTANYSNTLKPRANGYFSLKLEKYVLK